ncbi:MAG: hypothetical protein ACHQ01_02710 [Candidatus Limnocylindrales bacterium]
MIEILALLAVFGTVVALAFAVSVRLGILVGHRLDRFIEVRASAGGPDGLAVPGAPSVARPADIDADGIGEREDRGD